MNREPETLPESGGGQGKVPYPEAGPGESLAQDEPGTLLGAHPAACPFCGASIGTHVDWENTKCHRPGG